MHFPRDVYSLVGSKFYYNSSAEMSEVSSPLPKEIHPSISLRSASNINNTMDTLPDSLSSTPQDQVDRIQSQPSPKTTNSLDDNIDPYVNNSKNLSSHHTSPHSSPISKRNYSIKPLFTHQDNSQHASDSAANQLHTNELKQSRINKNDAMIYLEQVRSQFSDQPEIYGKFLDIMKEFKAHSITTELVIERVTTLFRGYPHLIEGFNAFIPEEHRIRVSLQKKNSASSDGTYSYPRSTSSSYSTLSIPLAPQTGLTKYLSTGTPSQHQQIEYSQHLDRTQGPGYNYGHGPITSVPVLSSSSSSYMPPNSSSSFGHHPMSQHHPHHVPNQPNHSSYSSSSTLTSSNSYHLHTPLSHNISSQSQLSTSTTGHTWNSMPPSSLISERNERESYPHEKILYSEKNQYHSDKSLAGTSLYSTGDRGYSTEKSYSPYYHHNQYNSHHSGEKAGSMYLADRSTQTATPYGASSYPSSSTTTSERYMNVDQRQTLYHNSNSYSTGITPISPYSTTFAEKTSNEKKSSMGMLQAVGYLRKIQDRFYGHPEVYQSFVEILRSYQREQRSIREVYSQVASLFIGHSDLLEEFSQFIPDVQNGGLAISSSAPSLIKSSTPSRKISTSSMGNSHGYSQHRLSPTSHPTAQHLPSYQGQVPTAQMHHYIQQGSVSSNSYDGPISSTFSSGTSNHISSFDGAKRSSDYLATGSTSAMSSTIKRARLGPLLGSFPTTSSSIDNFETDGQIINDGSNNLGLTSVRPSSSTNSHYSPAIATLPEGDFFIAVKSFLNGNEGTYGEFIKCLDFYTHRIVGKVDLLKLVIPFIGRSSKLFSRFTRMLDLDENEYQLHHHSLKDASISVEKEENGTVGAIAPRRLGSYRMLPENLNVLCSGRTSLCKEVLNDLMVSCPSFNSEDSTFVSSRKNAAEEALFKCEDERYELDLLIDGARSAITWLEAEKMNCGGGLNKSSITAIPATQKSFISRVWGIQASAIIKALQQSPSAVIPLIVTRLGQKLEEWRILFRDLNNRFWSEIHTKNVVKALDYQGTTFRSLDRKALSLRALVNEIHTVFVEQMKEGVNKIDSISVFALPSFGSNIKEKPIKTWNSKWPNGLEPCQLDWILSSAFIARTLITLLLKKEFVSVATGFQGDSLSCNGKRKAALGQFLTIFLPRFFTQGISVLYANEPLYLFFRLFQIAYCRLERIFQLAIMIEKKQNNIVIHPLTSLFGSDTNGYSFTKRSENNVSLFSTCVNLIEDLISNLIDTPTFEDSLRNLLGSNAFILFTFDRLLSLIGKQASVVLSDPISEQLVSLFENYGHPLQYSQKIDDKANARNNDGGRKIAISLMLSYTSTSNGNSSTTSSILQPFLFCIESIGKYVLSNISDENIKPISKSNEQLNINSADEIPGIFPEGYEWLLRFHVVPAPLSIYSSDLSSPASSLVQIADKKLGLEKWASYVDQFIGVKYDHHILGKSPPLLLERNMKRISIANNPLVSYQLELKLDVSSFRMAFVPGTEDCVIACKNV